MREYCKRYYQGYFMLKLAYYTEVDFRLSDGPAVNEREFINSLQNNINEPLIFLDKINRDVFDDKKRIFFFSKPYRVSHFLRYWKISRHINKVLKIRKINMLSVRVTDYPIVVLLLKLFNPKLKIYIKTAALWWAGRENSVGVKCFLYNKLNDALTRIVYKISSGIDVAMIETREELIRLGFATEKKIKLIDNAINTKIFTPSKRKKVSRSVVLGFAGSFPSFRGVAQMLSVGAKLQESYDIKIKIIGDDHNLKELIEKSRFPIEKVLCLGTINYFDVAKNIEDMTICYSFFEEWKIKKTGNASQKVKQYISMGKPVISVKTGHQYLVDNDLGSAVDQNDIDEIVRETEKWIQRVQLEGDALSDRLHAYACKHLSTEKTFQQRLEFWESLLEQ